MKINKLLGKLKSTKYPKTVNNYIVRSNALLVLVLITVFLITKSVFILIFICYGFWIRVLIGPKLCLLTFISKRFILPLFDNPSLKQSASPKRFAQGNGTFLTTISLGIHSFGYLPLANVIILILLFFVFLESTIGFCAGCWTYNQLVKLNAIRSEFCGDCNKA